MSGMYRLILLFAIAVLVLHSIAEAYSGIPKFSENEECMGPLGAHLVNESKLFPFTTSKTFGIKAAQQSLNSFNLQLLNKANISIYKLSFQNQSLSFSETCESTSQEKSMVTPLRVVDDKWTAFSVVLGKTLDASVARGQFAFTASLILKKPCVDVVWIKLETATGSYLNFNNCTEDQTLDDLTEETTRATETNSEATELNSEATELNSEATELNSEATDSNAGTTESDCRERELNNFLVVSLIFNGILIVALIFVAIMCKSATTDPSD